MTAGHAVLRGRRAKGDRRQLGAHALAITPDREIVLVKLRYAPGWRMPGGGRDPGEPLVEAALRELREEIGMTSHGAVTPLPHIEPALVMVEEVVFRPPNWSWEVERVTAAPLDRLPQGLAKPHASWLARFGEGG